MKSQNLTEQWHSLTGGKPLKSRIVEKDEIVQEGSLMVWHIPQIPGPAFHWPVNNVLESAQIVKCLASYDAFQFENDIKPDYSNASGLLVFEDGEWVEWDDPSTGEDFSSLVWRGDLADLLSISKGGSQ